MEELLHLKGVKTDFVQVDGETRVDVHIIDEQNHGQSTLVVDTLMVKDAHVKELLKKYEGAGKNQCGHHRRKPAK